MILTAIRRGADHYRLHAEGRDVGFVRGHALGFRGFASAAEAIEAARFAYATLGPWLLRQRRLGGGARRSYLLGVAHEGAATWLTAGDVRIGRVHELPARDPRGREPADFSFELWLPAGLGTALVLAGARQVYAAATRRALLAADLLLGPDAPRWPVTEREEPEQWFATSG
jgi:hypothetical protein